MIEQRGLAGAEKAGKHCDWEFLGGHVRRLNECRIG
jgi:hypothetical protein